EGADPPRQRRLAEVQSGAGPAEATGVDDGHEGAQVSQLHPMHSAHRLYDSKCIGHMAIRAPRLAAEEGHMRITSAILVLLCGIALPVSGHAQQEKLGRVASPTSCDA